MSVRDRRVQYETPGLERADLTDDPVVQWHRWYDEAVAGGLDEPNTMALATVDGEGRPDSRLVLVRGVDVDGLTFFTSYASPKSDHLTATPYAAATFAWLAHHRQVRVRGRVSRVNVAESDEYFASRPREHRLGAWASVQSAEIPDRAALEAALAEVTARFSGADVPRPPHWGGWRIEPEVWEFWQGRPNRLHDRFRYTAADGGWRVARLSP
jgi:pyridoxamine 5'-phosphate oxidase